MKTIFCPPEHEPDTLIECSKGHQFWVTPIGEENLEWSEKHKSLKAVCPTCGEREENEINLGGFNGIR